MTLLSDSPAVFSRRAFLGGSAGLAATAFLAACTGDGGDSAPSTSSASGGTSAPSRVVALSTGHLDHLLTLGIVPVGLAVAKSSGTDTRGIPDYINDRFGDTMDLGSIEVVGERQTPDLEKIAGLDPDLILSNDRTDRAQLDKLGGIARVVTTNGGSERWKEDLGILADAVGRRDQADKQLADYEARAKAWADARSGSPSISLVRGRASGYLTFGPLSLAGSVAADADLRRPASQQFTDKASHDLSLENVDQLDADHLFAGFAGDSGAVTDTPTWTSLPVVAAGHAHEVDLDPWFLNASLVAAEVVLDDMKRLIGG
jgi:iron complex transport system substrate-binding protein